jgi:hypothetical protein
VNETFFSLRILAKVALSTMAPHPTLFLGLRGKTARAETRLPLVEWRFIKRWFTKRNRPWIHLWP